ncbi:hypothetical protein BDFB_011993 [Asbolus verrucosus]|uniref:Uncharacterized protein n=1 Tax=Asbolus verrucosus TaxID=1661398 RepID=A0A482VLY0_ASBVE|nr:hypothetical protein BDFB_011993 [Asbolus verrucosus]
MLRATLSIEKNVDIKKHSSSITFIKRKSIGHYYGIVSSNSSFCFSNIFVLFVFPKVIQTT